MKHAREIKVGILAVVCSGILYFGFNFLKGVNISLQPIVIMDISSVAMV